MIEEKTDYDYASTAQVGSVITPEPLDLEDALVIPPEEFPAYENELDGAEVHIMDEVVAAASNEDEPEANPLKTA